MFTLRNVFGTTVQRAAYNDTAIATELGLVAIPLYIGRNDIVTSDESGLWNLTADHETRFAKTKRNGNLGDDHG